MLPQNLITPLFGLGGVCILIFLSTFHYFRDRVNNCIHDEITELFLSKETTSFIKGIKDGNVTSTMLRDFYNQLSNIWKLKLLLKSLLTYFPISSSLFIVSAILGSFIDYENLFYDYIIYSLLFTATAFFVLGTIQLIRLGKKLM